VGAVNLQLAAKIGVEMAPNKVSRYDDKPENFFFLMAEVITVLRYWKEFASQARTRR